MKHLIITFTTALSFTLGYCQNYNDLFTTYKNVTTQPTRKQQQQKQGYNTNNNGVAQYEVMDANQFFQGVAPQNTQTANGIYVKNGQFYSVKLKIGVSGSNQNQTVVSGYWDGQAWNNTTAYASPIGSYGVPEQIKRACTHQVYLPTIGTIYF